VKFYKTMNSKIIFNTMTISKRVYLHNFAVNDSVKIDFKTYANSW